MFSQWADAGYWFKKRDEVMDYARRNLAVITDKAGAWAYDRNDERVLECNKNLISKARDYHAIGMGKEPIFKKFLHISYDGANVGSLYVNPRKQQKV